MVPSPWSTLPQYQWRLQRFGDIERVVALLRPYADEVEGRQMDACLEHVRQTCALVALPRRTMTT